MSYWQHESPLACPKKHTMLWLGGGWWLCSKCKQVLLAIGTTEPTPSERETEAWFGR